MKWVQLCDSLNILWHCLSLGLEWKLTFSSPVATTEFSKSADILTAALLQHHLLRFEIAQLEFHHPPTSFAHLTSCSKMSGSRRVVTPSWLSGSWRSFLYSSSVYSCYLFLIFSASVRSIPFLSFIEPIFAWNVPVVSLIFFGEISSLSHSVVFFYFFALIAEERFLISSCYSLALCIQMLISFLFSFAFRFSSSHSYF